MVVLASRSPENPEKFVFATKFNRTPLLLGKYIRRIILIPYDQASVASVTGVDHQ